MGERTDGQTDRQRYRQTDRQIDRQTDDISHINIDITLFNLVFVEIISSARYRVH